MQEQFWEYKIHHVSLSTYGTPPDNKQDSLRNKANTELNELGLDRWECYFLEIRDREPFNGIKCFLKRQVTAETRMMLMRRTGRA